MNNRLEGYDFIRSVVIVVVFLGHILGKQTANEAVLLAIQSVSPGLTMSLLGFISAILLSSKDYDFGTFLVKRFTRIYISLFLCLGVVLTAHFCIGKNVLTQHALLHFMGLSAFFDLLLVQNKATIGSGLWFITAIVLMYLIFPFLQKLFRHKYGLFHLVSLIVLCTIAGFVMYGTNSIWNVVISFSVGVYLGSKGYVSMFAGAGITRPLLGALGLLVIVILSSSGFLPHSVRGLLYAFYPLAFVPLFLAVSKKFPPSVLAASSFFAGMSYEFYILHFYLINNGFTDFFPATISLFGQIVISFTVTCIISYIISQVASFIRKKADKYLLERA